MLRRTSRSRPGIRFIRAKPSARRTNSSRSGLEWAESRTSRTGSGQVLGYVLDSGPTFKKRWAVSDYFVFDPDHEEISQVLDTGCQCFITVSNHITRIEGYGNVTNSMSYWASGGRLWRAVLPGLRHRLNTWRLVGFMTSGYQVGSEVLFHQELSSGGYGFYVDRGLIRTLTSRKPARLSIGHEDERFSFGRRNCLDRLRTVEPCKGRDRQTVERRRRGHDHELRGHYGSEASSTDEQLRRLHGHRPTGIRHGGLVQTERPHDEPMDESQAGAANDRLARRDPSTDRSRRIARIEISKGAGTNESDHLGQIQRRKCGLGTSLWTGRSLRSPFKRSRSTGRLPFRPSLPVRRRTANHLLRRRSANVLGARSASPVALPEHVRSLERRGNTGPGWAASGTPTGSFRTSRAAIIRSRPEHGS